MQKCLELTILNPKLLLRKKHAHHVVKGKFTIVNV